MAQHDEPIDWSADTLDSRDIEGRIAYIESEIEIDDEERAELLERNKSYTSDTAETAPEHVSYLDDDERAELIEELTKLKEFAAYATGYSGDWNSGATLIADDHFVEYAKGYAESVGAIDDDARWPSNFIDWDAAADDLRTDFTSVEDPDGNTWWVR